MPSIFNIKEDYQALLDLMEELNEQGENPWENETVILWMKELRDNFRDKADDYVRVIKEKETAKDAIKDEKKRLDERSKMFDREISRMKDMIGFCMDEMKVKSFKTSFFSFSRRKAGGKQRLEVDVMPENLPVDYQVKQIVIKPDNEKIREELSAGKFVPHCRLLERGMITVIK